jgi:uncharacterized protein YkwD
MTAILVAAAVVAAVDDPKPAKPIDMPRLIELHNKERAEAKLPPLKANAKLEAAARAHAKEMADQGKMSHEGSDGSTPPQRIERAGYNFQNAGENVAEGQKSDEEVMASWMDSPPHKENILKPEFTEIGAACYVTKKGVSFWCVDFGRPWPKIDPEKSAEAMLDALNAARAEAKKPALKVNATLRDAAGRHARAMAEAGKFLPEDPDGTKPTTRAQEAGYEARAIAQDDAIGQAEPAKAVKSWIEGDGSRKIVLGDFSDVGIGVAADSKGVPYWTVLFGRPRKEAEK